MRKLLLLLLLCTSIAANAADNVWCMVTDSGAKIAMNRIGFLLASDQSDVFDIVCNDGEVIYGVATATFEQTVPTGIDSPVGKSEAEVTIMPASEEIRLMGCKEGTKVSIYDTAGRNVKQVTLNSAEGTVFIGDLPKGIYVVSVGKARVKFMKK